MYINPAFISILTKTWLCIYRIQFPNDEPTSWLSKLPEHRCHTAKRRLKPKSWFKSRHPRGKLTTTQWRPQPLPEILFVSVPGNWGEEMNKWMAWSICTSRLGRKGTIRKIVWVLWKGLGFRKISLVLVWHVRKLRQEGHFRKPSQSLKWRW